MSKKSVLVLGSWSDEYTNQKTYQHLHLFDRLRDSYDPTYVNVRLWMKMDADKHVIRQLQTKRFDVVVLHYTMLYSRTNPRFSIVLEAIKPICEKAALRVAFPQDEGTMAYFLDEILFLLCVDVIFSGLYRDGTPLYPLSREVALIHPCFPGYLEESLTNTLAPPIAERSIDIFYRARGEPKYFGESLYLKGQIGREFKKFTQGRNIVTDISLKTEDRLNGREWYDTLRNSKLVLGSYAGYNTIDGRGEKNDQFKYMASKGDIDDNNHILNFLSESEWNHCELHTIASRHFEAVACGACQALVEGEYRGVLEPNVHYLAVKKDFSNLADIVDKTMDTALLQSIADAAYSRIVESNEFGFGRFALEVASVIDGVIEHGRVKKSPSISERVDRLYMDSIKHQKVLSQRWLLHNTFGPQCFTYQNDYATPVNLEGIGKRQLLIALLKSFPRLTTLIRALLRFKKGVFG